MITEFYFVAVIKANYLHDSVLQAHRFTGAHIGLEVSDNIDKTYYYDKPKLFNKKGSKVFTEAAIEGLVANIHTAHQKGWRDSAEHLRFIIERLTEGFAVVSDVKEDIQDIAVSDKLNDKPESYNQ